MLNGATLAELHKERELATPIGIATIRDGTWLSPIGGTPGTAEVLAIDLDRPASLVRVVMEGPNWTTYGLRYGKVVAAHPAQTQPGQAFLTAASIDRVVIHAQHASSWQVCATAESDTAGWATIAKLQLPLRSVDSALPDAAAEWDVAHGRLITGDDLDQSVFVEVADMLRGVGGDPLVRPIDRTIRPDPDFPDMYLNALDPLRLALLDPVLRRALGLAYFDGDPALVAGETYQYRVSGKFPSDAELARPGFHSVPVGTPMPPDFFLGDAHVIMSEPRPVEFVASGTVGDLVVGRRSVALRARGRTSWLLPDLLDNALLIEFALPRTALALQVADADLGFAAFDADDNELAVNDTTVDGELRLAFSAPCARLLVRGKGRWLGMRDPAASTASTTLTATALPVVFAQGPPPAPPMSIRAASTNTAQNSSAPFPRSELGFDVAWAPPQAFGVTWPPDAEAAAPLDETRFELEHDPENGAFTPVFGKRGQAFGDRTGAAPQAPGPGADLSVLYPEQPAPASGGAEFTIRDQFDREPPMVQPHPGSMHRYRVRTLDEIGRASAWVSTPAVQLKKLAPPPIPADVQARVLVSGAPDLTAGERTLLTDNGATTAIIVRWRWTAEQRDIDPWATEFRVYRGTGGVGPVTGQITVVAATGGGRFDVTIALTRSVTQDSARGGYLPAGGEYRILGHDAGDAIHATVETRLPDATGAFSPPRLGPTTLPIPLRPDQSRAAAWDERVTAVAITDAEAYEFMMFDVLAPTADRPTDTVWVGVSAADDQSYVLDSRTGGGRPGNESPVAPVRCEARYQRRPTLDAPPPPIADVPAVATARPSAAGVVEHSLDISPFLAAAPLGAGESVAVEKLDEGALLTAMRADGRDVIAVAPATAPRGSADVPIAVPNPADRAAIVESLTGNRLSMADRYLVWLAAHHPYADWLFTGLDSANHALGSPARFVLTGGGGRHVLRVRRVDAAGHRSDGAAMCAVVLRVPSLAPPAPPAFAGARWTATAGGPRLELRATVPDERSTHLLMWVASTDPRRAQLATIGSRRELPGFGVRLRPADGSALTPEVVALNSNTVTDPQTGARSVTILQNPSDGTHFVWLATVDEDAVPSRLSGAFRLPKRGS